MIIARSKSESQDFVLNNVMPNISLDKRGYDRMIFGINDLGKKVSISGCKLDYHTDLIVSRIIFTLENNKYNFLNNKEGGYLDLYNLSSTLNRMQNRGSEIIFFDLTQEKNLMFLQNQFRITATVQGLKQLLSTLEKTNLSVYSTMNTIEALRKVLDIKDKTLLLRTVKAILYYIDRCGVSNQNYHHTISYAIGTLRHLCITPETIQLFNNFLLQLLPKVDTLFNRDDVLFSSMNAIHTPTFFADTKVVKLMKDIIRPDIDILQKNIPKALLRKTMENKS
jgi:hypothetical protein